MNEVFNQHRLNELLKKEKFNFTTQININVVFFNAKDDDLEELKQARIEFANKLTDIANHLNKFVPNQIMQTFQILMKKENRIIIPDLN